MFIGVQQKRNRHRSTSVVIEGKTYPWAIYKSIHGLVDSYREVTSRPEDWIITPKEELKSIYLIPFQFTEGSSNE